MQIISVHGKGEVRVDVFTVLVLHIDSLLLLHLCDALRGFLRIPTFGGSI